jgi:hypothetical protein
LIKLAIMAQNNKKQIWYFKLYFNLIYIIAKNT